MFGIGGRFGPEWAAWANGVAVRELDFHDTFLAAEYSHPGDNIPPILAVAQHAGADGAALLRGIAHGYEIQIDLARAICLHAHKIDHVAHLGPSAAAGIGTMLGLRSTTVYQAIGQALHTTTATRQSRKGEISTWKAYAPAFAGKMAVEAVDRAMRGQTSPTPDLGGRGRRHRPAARRPGCGLRGAAAGAGRALAGDPRELTRRSTPRSTRRRRGSTSPAACAPSTRSSSRPAPCGRRAAHLAPHALRDRIRGERPAEVRPEGQPGDPRPLAAVHLRGGAAGRRLASRRLVRPRAGGAARHRGALAIDHHRRGPRVDAPLPLARPGRAGLRRPGRVRARRRHDAVAEIAVADAHPLGARPFARADYVRKFRTLAEGVLAPEEIDRFLDVAERLPSLTSGELAGLTITATDLPPAPKGLF